MGLIEIFGGVALVIGDILAGMSLLGSALLLVTAFTAGSRSRGSIRERALQWSVMGLVFGIGCQVCLFLSHQDTHPEGFMLRIQPELVNLMLGLSLVVFVLATVIRRMIASEYR